MLLRVQNFCPRQYFNKSKEWKNKTKDRPIPIVIKSLNYNYVYSSLETDIAIIENPNFGFKSAQFWWTCQTIPPPPKRLGSDLGTERKKKCRGSLSTIDFSKVQLGVGILCNSPRQVRAKSLLLISYDLLWAKMLILSLIGHIFKRLLVNNYGPSASMVVKGWRVPKFGWKYKILAICTMMLMWVSP